MTILLQLAGVLVIVASLAIVTGTVRILRAHERAVIFTRGRFSGVGGPGLVLILPLIQEMMHVDLRIQMVEIPSGYLIWQDSAWMMDANRQRSHRGPS